MTALIVLLQAGAGDAAAGSSSLVELLRTPFVQDAFKAALMVAVLCSFLGVFVVLKRIVFVGAALAEAASLGAALSFFGPAIWAFERLSAAVPALAGLNEARPVVLAMLAVLIAVAVFAQPGLGRRIPREAIIGAAFGGAMGLTVLVLSSVPAESEHAQDFLNGNILGVSQLELIQLAVTCIVVAIIQALFYKEFVLVSFDPEVAQTLGYRSARWELLWYLSLGVMIAVSIHVAGLALVFAYLVLPAVSALLLSRRLGAVFLLAIVVGIVSTAAGVVISLSWPNLPMGPTIVACLVAALAICGLLSVLGRAFAPRAKV